MTVTREAMISSQQAGSLALQAVSFAFHGDNRRAIRGLYRGAVLFNHADPKVGGAKVGIATSAQLRGLSLFSEAARLGYG